VVVLSVALSVKCTTTNDLWLKIEIYALDGFSELAQDCCTDAMDLLVKGRQYNIPSLL